MISQKCSAQVFDRMDFRRIHDRFIVWACHADIKSGDHSIADFILSGHIDSRHKPDMIHCETRNFIHLHFFESSVFSSILLF